MIRVNLLAAHSGTAAPRVWVPTEQRSALMGLGLLALTALGVGGWWYYLHSERSTVEAKITASESELVRLKDAADLVTKVTARKNELTERLHLIERLRSSKREPVTLLESVSRALPDGLWLLEMKQAGTTVTIDGRAMSLTALTDFAERIQNSGTFRHPIEIVSTSTETVENVDVVRFALKAEAVTSAPAAPLEKAVAKPARTGA